VLFASLALVCFVLGHVRAVSAYPNLLLSACPLGLATGLLLWRSKLVAGVGGAISGVVLIALFAHVEVSPGAWSGGVERHTLYDLDAETDEAGRFIERARLPYLLAHGREDVLVLDAGGGNDVAMALRMGALRVDAVEADSALLEAGVQHPQAPWKSTGVTLHRSSARTYLGSCERTYDLIIFPTPDLRSLPDSHPDLLRRQWLYTTESMELACALLKPMGILAVPLSQGPDFVGDRIYLMLTRAAGRPPLQVSLGEGRPFSKLFLQGEPVPLRDPDPAHAARLSDVSVPTDNWPFLLVSGPEVLWSHAILPFLLLLLTFGVGLASRSARAESICVPLAATGASSALLGLLGKEGANAFLPLESLAWPCALAVAVLPMAAFLIPRSGRDRALTRAGFGALLLGASAGFSLDHLALWLGNASVLLLAVALALPAALPGSRRAA